MQSKQMDVGNRTEKAIGKMFKKNGFWCCIIPKNSAGAQPVDIVACRKNVNFLVDAKHLRAPMKSFPLARIEPNQWETFNYSRTKCGIKNLGIVICIEDDYEHAYFLSYDKILELEDNAKKSIKISELEDFEKVLQNV